MIRIRRSCWTGQSKISTNMKISKNTQIEKIIPELVKVSFKENRLYKPKVDQIIKVLGKLSKGTAIRALTLYMKGLKQYLGQYRLTIESSVPLTKSQIDQIEELINQSQPVFETEVNINPDLLGGIKIRVGDNIYDDSLADKIEQVRERIRN